MLNNDVEPTQLGELLRKYKPNLFTNLQNIVIGILLLLLGLLLGTTVLAAFSDIPNPAGVGWSVMLIVLILLTFGSLGGGGYLLYQVFRESRHKLFLYEQGLVDIEGNKTRSVCYEDITVWQKIVREYVYFVLHVRTTYLYTIQLPDETKIKIRNKQVGELLQERVCHYQLPLAIATYNEGRDVNFGTLTVSKEKLTVEGEAFSWTEIEAIQIKNGSISVKQKNGSWFNQVNTQVVDIPNIFVFLTLVEQLGYLSP
ncbi:MAG TPA: DUF6585 family protein [Coleofasciculaceae cyanobacterium]